VAVAHPAARLPDPMAPLSISDLVPPQRAPAPLTRSASAAVTAPRLNATAAPVILAAPPLAGKTRVSSTVITALVLAGAALALAAISVLAWKATNRASVTERATAPSTPRVSLPPRLEPLPVPETNGVRPGENRKPATSTPITHGEKAGQAVAVNVPRNDGAPSKTESLQPAPTAKTEAPSAPATSPAPKPKPASIGGRQPVPESDSLDKAEEAARKLYASELKAANKSLEQMALAGTILSAGRATQNDLTARFALFDLARTLFIQAGDADEAVTAARLLEIEYDIPRNQLISDTVEALDKGSIIPEQRLAFTRTAADLADAAIDAQEFDRAERLANIAVQSAAKLRDVELRKDLLDRRNQILRLVKEWNTIKPNLEKLKSDPNDAAANLVAGKFYCFSLEDFHKGLPYLAACGEPTLADAAKLDLAAQTADAAKRFEAAKAWQKAQIKIIDREDKLAAQRREKWLLQQAVVGLTGTEQMEANKRLGQLQNVGGPAGGRKTGEVPAPTIPVKTKKKK